MYFLQASRGCTVADRVRVSCGRVRPGRVSPCLGVQRSALGAAARPRRGGRSMPSGTKRHDTRRPIHTSMLSRAVSTALCAASSEQPPRPIPDLPPSEGSGACTGTAKPRLGARAGRARGRGGVNPVTLGTLSRRNLRLRFGSAGRRVPSDPSIPRVAGWEAADVPTRFGMSEASCVLAGGRWAGRCQAGSVAEAYTRGALAGPPWGAGCGSAAGYQEMGRMERGRYTFASVARRRLVSRRRAVAALRAALRALRRARAVRERCSGTQSTGVSLVTRAHCRPCVHVKRARHSCVRGRGRGVTGGWGGSGGGAWPTGPAWPSSSTLQGTRPSVNSSGGAGGGGWTRASHANIAELQSLKAR